MPNDDLGQFPMPSQSNTAPTSTDVPSTPNIPMDNTQLAPQPATQFEETPEEIPSVYNQPQETSEPPVPPVLSEANSIPSPYIPQPEPVIQTPPPAAQPPLSQPIPATLPKSSGLGMGPIIFAVIFIVAVVALAGAAYLYQQSQTLQKQLTDITKTIEKQKTSPETTPTPSVVEVPVTSPTLTPTPSSTISAIPTLPLTPTPTTALSPGSPMKPLSITPEVMQIAVKQQPNAQLILIKTENANDPAKAITKYFFRQDLTTKKYFYILISGTNEPEVVDKQIFVTPDDNIPSLNDLVLQNKLGIDLDEAIAIVNSSCPDQAVCAAAQAKAQYIKTSAGVIWQISLTVAGKTEPMVMQINAQTKVVIFKTNDFSK